MINKNSCKNFNHGRILVSIQYCPDCGERFNVATDNKDCSVDSHLEKAKKYIFCCDCGLEIILKKKSIYSFLIMFVVFLNK